MASIERTAYPRFPKLLMPHYLKRLFSPTAEEVTGVEGFARKADRRSTFEQNPHWAEAPLCALVDRKLIEINDSGHYQFTKPGYQK